MNPEILNEILSKYEWPEPYKFEDDLPDGIVVGFPKSNIYFSEGYDGEITLYFLTSDTKTGSNLSLFDALSAIFQILKI